MLEDKIIIKLKDKCYDFFLKVDCKNPLELKKWDFPNKAGKVGERSRCM